MEEINIEFATASDASRLLELVRELAIYEKSENAVRTLTVDYEEGITQDYFRALVARDGNREIVGMALFYPVFSTWNGRTMYLEDFIVSKSHRGLGIGKMLFERWMEEAKKMGVNMLKWQVLDWNLDAKRFYLKYETHFYPGWENGVIYLNK